MRFRRGVFYGPENAAGNLPIFRVSKCLGLTPAFGAG
jgi:hypothetical protein